MYLDFQFVKLAFVDHFVYSNRTEILSKKCETLFNRLPPLQMKSVKLCVLKVTQNSPYLHLRAPMLASGLQQMSSNSQMKQNLFNDFYPLKLLQFIQISCRCHTYLCVTLQTVMISDTFTQTTVNTLYLSGSLWRVILLLFMVSLPLALFHFFYYFYYLKYCSSSKQDWYAKMF